MSGPDNVEAAIVAAGQDPARVLAQAASPEVKAGFKAQGERAMTRGLFGSPSFVVSGELFWGDDRLEDALAFAASHGARR